MEELLTQRERIPPMDLQFLLAIWGGRCAYCGTSVGQGDHAIDHIRPVTRGGPTTIANLTLTCPPCNTRKGTRTADEFGCPDVTLKAQAIADIASIIWVATVGGDVVLTGRILDIASNATIRDGMRLPWT